MLGHVEAADSLSLQPTNLTEEDFQKGPELCFLTSSPLYTNYCLLETWPKSAVKKGGVCFIISLE